MGTSEDSFNLPAQPTAPGYARAIVREAVGRSLPAAVLEAIELCVSELVTNAIDHAVPPYRLRIARDGTGLCVAVDDGSAPHPEVRASAPGAERGRGMFLVAELSSGWGVHDRADGKSVWVRFDA